MVKEVKASNAVIAATKASSGKDGAKALQDLQKATSVGGKIGSAVGSFAGPVGKIIGKNIGQSLGVRALNKKAKGGMVSKFSSISKPQRFKGTY
jgi:hypothetical protein